MMEELIKQFLKDKEWDFSDDLDIFLEWYNNLSSVFGGCENCGNPDLLVGDYIQTCEYCGEEWFIDYNKVTYDWEKRIVPMQLKRIEE